VKDLKKVKVRRMRLLETTFPGEEVAAFELCGTCCKALDERKVPTLSRSNGFKYPPKPVGLPPLDPISARLISPRLPFMQIGRLRYEENYGIVVQVILVPVDVNTMERSLFQALI
jgi:hypothetical protein